MPLNIFTLKNHPERGDENRRLYWQIMCQECKPFMCEEEIYFDILSMEVLELVGGVVELEY